MQTLQIRSHRMMKLQLRAIQRWMVVMSAVVVVEIAVVVVVDNVRSAQKALQLQPLLLLIPLVAPGHHPVWLDHRQPCLQAN
jgi:hypothetical protein